MLAAMTPVIRGTTYMVVEVLWLAVGGGCGLDQIVVEGVELSHDD